MSEYHTLGPGPESHETVAATAVVNHVLWVTRDLDREGQAVALVEYGACATIDAARVLLAEKAQAEASARYEANPTEANYYAADDAVRAAAAARLRARS